MSLEDQLADDEHIEIRCDKCKHRIRYHEKGQFACIVKGCDCTKIEPIEVIVKHKDEADIVTTKNGVLVK